MSPPAAKISERIREIYEWRNFTYRFDLSTLHTILAPEACHTRVKWEGNLLMNALKNVYGA